MLDFLKREHWNHDCIDARPVEADWDRLRGENSDGVEVILPPLTADTLSQYDAEPDEFDAEGWLLENLSSHTTADQNEHVADMAEADDQDPEDWLLQNWRTFLPAEKIAEIEEALAEAKDEHDTDALEEAKEAFEHSDGWYEWKDGFEPVMNGYWPVTLAYRLDAETAAARIDQYGGSTALVWIESANTHAIILTGGGMDLSWDICAAYICCGCVPPARLLLDLPRFTSRFGELIVNTLLPLLVEHREWQAKRARDETARLAEHLLPNPITDLVRG